MREGINPNKKSSERLSKFDHRVITAIYVPKIDGYYKDALDVLSLFLNSLFDTIDRKTAVSIIDNGSCEEVKELISKYETKIDCLVIYRENIGKVDALIGCARSSSEELITLTDSDIFFQPNWITEVKNIFNSFDNVGSVSPIPVRVGRNYYTSSTLKKVLFRKLKYELQHIPENTENYNKYLQSINWDVEKENKLWDVVIANQCKAIIGSGHQILTMSRNILFTHTPTLPSMTLIGNKSEENYIDRSIDLANKLRLSTYHNHAYHIGNKVEEWMRVLYESNKSDNSIVSDNIQIRININSELRITKFRLMKYSLKKIIVKSLFNLFHRSL